ncbi:MAG: deoxyribodipyrimidine photo-lyase [Pseudomonadota bacterium]
MASSDPPVIVLFDRDLRVDDNPALAKAAETGQPVIPLYVEDVDEAGAWAPGGAKKWWLHHSLEALGRDLKKLGAELVLRRGDTITIVSDIARKTGATGVYLCRGYEPWAPARERALNDVLGKDDITVTRTAGRLLIEPDQIRTKTGDVYKVYTPFWRAVSNAGVRTPVDAPHSLNGFAGKIASDTLADWGYLPTKPDWAEGFEDVWAPGADGGRERFAAFVDDAIADYDDKRNRPDLPGTSRLSPHFHHGEVSPARCWFAVLPLLDDKKTSKGAETFLKELVWREFSYHLLFNFPHLPVAPFREQFSAFPWRSDKTALKAWQRGRTGYPIVDAGMRELWATGWMHNRVRMIVGSFLTKNLLLPWQDGEAWFWDCLVDADLASNSASWQWVSGSGADAAPYFRIFNPVKQSETYDPHGDYIRKWVPELAGLETKQIHAPWDATASQLKAGKVSLGDSYPQPIVGHKETRERALAAYDKIKTSKS